MTEKNQIQVPEQIDLMVNSECNARCQMCVQEITWKIPTKSGDPFIEGVAKHMQEFYDFGGRNVIITGGEPTLRPGRVVSALEALAKYKDLELVAMYTNGSRLLNSENDKTIAQRLKDAGLQYVNLSLHHFDQEKNNRIFGINVGNAEIKCKHLNDVGISYRFCATLQKGGLENVNDILRYLEFAQKNGAKDVYFREFFKLFNVNTNNNTIRSRLEYIDFNFVPIQPIVEGLKEKGLISIGRRNSFQGRQKDELSFVTQSSFPFYTSQLEIGREISEQLPYLVVMPNGKLYATWMGKEFEIDNLKEFMAKPRGVLK